MRRYFYLFVISAILIGCASKNSAPTDGLNGANIKSKTAIEKLKNNEPVFAIAVTEIAVRDKIILAEPLGNYEKQGSPENLPIKEYPDEKIDNGSASSENAEKSTLLENVNKTEIKTIAYQDLQGAAASIRANLVKNGYLIQPSKFSSNVTGTGNHLSVIAEQIKAGEYIGAKYVLFGVLTEISEVTNQEKIIGTNRKMDTKGIELLVDFSLFDVESQKVIAAFSAFGKGLDRKILDADSTHEMPKARLIYKAYDSLSDNVYDNLIEQGFLSPKSSKSTSDVIPKGKLDEDSSTLIIYK
jgi:hypothetical protein